MRAVRLCGKADDGKTEVGDGLTRARDTGLRIDDDRLARRRNELRNRTRRTNRRTARCRDREAGPAIDPHTIERDVLRCYIMQQENGKG